MEISYHIDKKILKRWDALKSGKLKKKDEDRVYIVDGRERTGKSVLALQFAKYIDPQFNIDRVCFSPEEFLKQIRTAPPGSVIIFDEAFRGLSSKSTQSKVNKAIVQAMMEMGQRNLIIFIVLPTFFLLELYAAVLRSNALFHVFKDKDGKRVYKSYNYKNKSMLYNVGKKKGFSYAFPIISARKTGGRFFDKYAIDEAVYRKKKMDSLIEEESIKKEEVSRFVIQRDRLIALNYFLFKKMFPKMSKTRYTDILGNYVDGINLENAKKITVAQKDIGLGMEIWDFGTVTGGNANNIMIELTQAGNKKRQATLAQKMGYNEVIPAFEEPPEPEEDEEDDVEPEVEPVHVKVEAVEAPEEEPQAPEHLELPDVENPRQSEATGIKEI